MPKEGKSLMELAALLGEVKRARPTPEWLEAVKGEVEALEARVADLRARWGWEKDKKQLKLTEKLAQHPFPPPGSLLEGWMEVLSELELQLLKTARELAEAMKGQTDRNLFDLLAVVNQLLDTLARLHQRVEVIYTHTAAKLDRVVSPKGPLHIKPEVLYGPLSHEADKDPDHEQRRLD